MSTLTVITSTKPAKVCKRFTMGSDGKLVKTAVANIIEGTAQCFDVPDTDTMVALLRQVTQSDNQVIVSGRWHDCTDQPFHIVPEEKLAKLMDLPVGNDALGGVQNHKGKLIAARLKRGIDPSDWLLLDADNRPGMPDKWKPLTIQQRLELWEPMHPGISTCERVELRGSTSRVHLSDEEPGPATHAWMLVDDASAIEGMRTFTQVAMVNHGLSFPSPRYSRIEPDKNIGYEHRSVFDLAVLITGRLVFCSQPDVEPDGYVAADADVRIVNRGGGPLRIGHLRQPDEAALAAYGEKTGHTVKLNENGVTSIGQLTADTEIERRGKVKKLSEWLAPMKPNGKLRCEAPFRASQSEAAVIVKNEDGSAIVHDVGNSTTYVMGSERNEPMPPPEPQWPQPLADAAYHGLAGEFVRAIAPFSEADPAALLASLMVATGNAIGRTTHYQVEDDLHHTNLFVVLVGQTSKARKGTSWGRIRRILKRVALDWTTTCIGSGLSSGEGIIHALRDPTGEKDEGVKDKRLLLIESEFAGMLRIMARDGNSLSAVLRDCYDGKDLRIMNKNSPETATAPHISLLGHCTAEEIRRNLDDTSRANGFANRIIFICVDRSRELPFGADREQLDAALRPLEERLAVLMEQYKGQPDRPVTWDRGGSELWRSVYSDLSRGKPGMAGAIVGRAEAHVVRLALLYALLDDMVLDGVRWIGKEHLEAALALWKYSEQSVGYIFGNALGDPVADTILQTLRQAREKGLSRTEISRLFSNNVSSAQLDRALALLQRSRLADPKELPSAGGRPATVWKART